MYRMLNKKTVQHATVSRNKLLTYNFQLMLSQKTISITRLLFALPFVLFAASCTNISPTENHYERTSDNDTMNLKIILSDTHFYGTYYHKIKGKHPVDGKIQGKLFGDTLIGRINYTPYQHKNEKIKAFSVLLGERSIIIGKGSEVIYLGIPYHKIETLDFSSQDSVLYQLL